MSTGPSGTTAMRGARDRSRGRSSAARAIAALPVTDR